MTPNKRQIEKAEEIISESNLQRAHKALEDALEIIPESIKKGGFTPRKEVTQIEPAFFEKPAPEMGKDREKDEPIGEGEKP